MRIRKRTFKRGRRPIRRRKARKVKRKRAAARRRAIKPEVKKNTGTYTLTSYNGVINSAGDFINLVPDIAAGTAANQRIGTRINPIKIVIRGYVAYKATSFADSRMIGVRQFLLRPRTNNSDPTFTIGSAQLHLLEYGAVTGTYNGTVDAHLAPHNTDQWKFLKDRKFNMYKPFGQMSLVVPTNANSMACPNASLFRPFTFTIKGKQLPAQFIYDENISVVQPTNYSVYHAIGYADLLGATADVASTQIMVGMNTTLYYTDP